MDSTDFCIRPISDESTEKNENGRLLIRHNKTIVEFSAKIASLKINMSMSSVNHDRPDITALVDWA